MHRHYEDILRRVGESPAWFDEAAVPRFDPFAPTMLANIYADEAALAEISCQACGRRFRVALNGCFADEGLSLGDTIRLRRVHYGDPPNVGCCPAGPTMNSEMHAVLEYWSRDHEVAFEWRRDRSLEGPVGEDRLDPVDAASEVLATIDGGAATVRVACSSHRSRYALLGRLVAAMAGRGGRVLLAYPFGYLVMAPHAVKGHMPDNEVDRWEAGRSVALAPFDRLPPASGEVFGWTVILAGPTPSEAGRAEWAAAAECLASHATGRVRVELVLVHSGRMLEYPDAVIDAGRVAPAGA